MSTVNISLPQEQVVFIDGLAKRYGFSNRSEFIRGLLRLIRHRPHIVEEAIAHPFVSPDSRSVKQIVSDFRKSKKYSDAFIRDLEDGLKNSTYFKP